MTRRIIWIIVLSVLAVAFAFGATNHPGTIQIEWLNHQATLSIYLFALLFLLAFTLFFWLWRFYRGVIALPSRFSNWREDRREQRALAALQTATLALQEGRWLHAEKAARIAAKNPTAAGLAALIGASAAHARSDDDQARRWLSQLDAHPQFVDAKLLQEAEMALTNDEAPRALELLDKTSNGLRKNSLRYKELLIAAQAKTSNWQSVKQLASERKSTLAIEDKHAWMKQAIAGLSADSSQSIEDLRKLYRDMPDGVRTDDAAVHTLVRALIARGANSDARRIIQESMREQWRPVLLNDYVAAAQSDSVTEQLKMCQAWQAQGHDDNALALVTGQLCLRAGLWGQAKKQFETVVQTAPSVPAYSGLGQALRRMGEEEAAQKAERQASGLHEILPLP